MGTADISCSPSVMTQLYMLVGCCVIMLCLAELFPEEQVWQLAPYTTRRETCLPRPSLIKVRTAQKPMIQGIYQLSRFCLLDTFWRV